MIRWQRLQDAIASKHEPPAVATIDDQRRVRPDRSHGGQPSVLLGALAFATDLRGCIACEVGYEQVVVADVENQEAPI
jgi:hypothetical protein